MCKGKEKNLISKFLLASLSTVDTSKVDSSFIDKLRAYLNNDVVKDVDSMATSLPQVNHLKQLFMFNVSSIHQ